MTKKTRRKVFTDDLLALAYEMRTSGIKWKRIAGELNVSAESLRSTFSKRLK